MLTDSQLIELYKRFVVSFQSRFRKKIGVIDKITFEELFFDAFHDGLIEFRWRYSTDYRTEQADYYLYRIVETKLYKELKVLNKYRYDEPSTEIEPEAEIAGTEPMFESEFERFIYREAITMGIIQAKGNTDYGEKEKKLFSNIRPIVRLRQWLAAESRDQPVGDVFTERELLVPEDTLLPDRPEELVRLYRWVAALPN